MKKIVKILSSALLSAVVAVSATAAVSAAGINDAEQKILDELKTTVTMNGSVKSIPADYVNQAENYFNTVDVTDSEAEQIITAIEDAKTYLAGTGVSKAKDLSSEQVDTFVSKVQSALSVINLTLQYTKSTGAVSIVDSNGKVVFSTTTISFPDGSNPIKTTGADFNIPGIVAIAGIGVLLVSAAGVYLFKASKKDTKAYEARA